jgi:hypothetical protein
MSLIGKTQYQLDEVRVIMRDNIEKVLERDCKLVDIETKSEQLKDGADYFRMTSRKLRLQMWLQDKKMMCLLIFIVLVVLLIIIIPIAAT